MVYSKKKELTGEMTRERRMEGSKEPQLPTKGASITTTWETEFKRQSLEKKGLT